MKPKRVLIVDDSATIRHLIRRRILSDPRLEVVGEAGDPYEARALIKSLNPDVLTLDVEMPRMNGLAFLERLMRLRPMPVVMVSTETHKGSAAALEALSLGAIECIGKPRFDGVEEPFATLPDLLVAAGSARLRSQIKRLPIAAAQEFSWNGKIVLIGSSTGGVDALETLLKSFPENSPPTLITQHMPESFLASFAKRLDRQVAPKVLLASNGTAITQGHIYLAPGGRFHLELDGRAALFCRLMEGDKRNGHRPSVEVLFNSALEHAERCVAVMLTGMGRDGADGMLKLRRAGARCLAQDEETSVVFGMPRAALENGGAERAVPLEKIADDVLELCRESTGLLANQKRQP
ncbi:protein-glutamate methylesterase/protein-glutamine glutaminase [Thioclava pacifica]|uniref:protein-glutamate methylesterase/protein-glutamine glutaminase n=1 Tax=Thioclava pacifica TaxID=285109 RepID=UPI000A010058|nr:chemotaxis response regulator protein-glutamate methylesterase [Thioclava pacifica]